METVKQSDGRPSESPTQNMSHNSSHNNKPNKRKHAQTTDTTPDSSKYCMLHGDCGHTTEQCRVLQREAKRLKSRDVPTERTECKQDDHQRACPKHSTNSTHELRAIIEEAVQRMIQRPKCKASDSGLDLKAFEKLSVSDDNYSDATCQKASDDNTISESLNDYFALSTIRAPSTKRLKTEVNQLAPITFA